MKCTFICSDVFEESFALKEDILWFLSHRQQQFLEDRRATYPGYHRQRSDGQPQAKLKFDLKDQNEKFEHPNIALFS
jgi:hypothetical protein